MWPFKSKRRFVFRRPARDVWIPMRFTLAELYTGVEKMVTLIPVGPVMHKLCDQLDSSCNSDQLVVKLFPGTPAGLELWFLGFIAPQGMFPGDLIIVVEEEPHAVFERKGFDLYATKKISLLESLTEHTFTIETLDNRSLTISKAEPGHVVIIPNEGMPIPESGEKGSLFVRFEVVLPNLSLSDEQKGDLKKLLS